MNWVNDSNEQISDNSTLAKRAERAAQEHGANYLHLKIWYNWNWRRRDKLALC